MALIFRGHSHISLIYSQLQKASEITSLSCDMGRDTVEETAVTAAKQGRPQGWGLPYP